MNKDGGTIQLDFMGGSCYEGDMSSWGSPSPPTRETLDGHG